MILVSVPTRTCHYVHNISNGLTARPVADVPQYPTLVTGGLPVTDNHFFTVIDKRFCSSGDVLWNPLVTNGRYL